LLSRGIGYLCALLEVQARLATAKLGLDPGLGVLHADTQYRESLACDVMELIRPEVDAFVLELLQREPLLRSYFFEERDGNCRLTSSFASKLSETAPIWARLVAPVAESFTQQIHKSRTSQNRSRLPARLTSATRQETKISSDVERKLSFRRANVCATCGKKIHSRSTNWDECAKQDKSHQLIGRRARNLADRGLVRRELNEQNRREFLITSLALDSYFKRIDDDELYVPTD
jgi:hypothetical protein